MQDTQYPQWMVQNSYKSNERQFKLNSPWIRDDLDGDFRKNSYGLWELKCLEAFSFSERLSNCVAPDENPDPISDRQTDRQGEQGPVRWRGAVRSLD